MPVGANGAIGGLNVNVGVNLTQFSSGMDTVERRGQQVATNLNKIGSSLTSGAAMGAGFAVATAALSELGQAASSSVGAVVGLSSQLEQSRIGFTAFTKDGEKANNFIKQLQQFAATTTFEFPGLLQGARQLTGMGVQAELVIPILKDVAGAVMAVGGGEEQIKGVNRALTQMMAAGKVNAQDMNQLAQAGIPAWKMLADSMGMTIGQVRKLSEEGKISAAQMLQAFHNFVQNNGLAEMAEKSGQTWQAATSNIKDGLLIIATEGFGPLFDVMRNAAVQLANFLTSDQARDFAQDLKATIQDLTNMAAPLGAAFQRAFEAFKTDGISGAFNSILTDVQSLASQMGGAGVQLISEFAGGIISGAGNLITEAANFVADIIASYLIGSSPPPVGPLSQIAQGGTNVIAAYVDGMKQGLTGIDDVAQGIATALGEVNRTMTLTEGIAALKTAGTDMKALQAVSEDAEGVLRNLDDMIKDNQASLRDYQNAATDIKDAYSAAIEPLQQQVDALKEVNDLTQKQADIQSKIQLAQLKGQLSRAQGDPVRRAQLQNQLDTLEQQEKSLSLQERALSLDKQSADLGTKARADELKNAAAKARAKGDTEAAKKLTEQAAALTRGDVGDSQRINALAQQRLQLQQQQNAIQIQMEGLVDKEAVARIKGQQAQVQAVKDQRDINAEVANLNRELQAAPLEQQIKDLQAQQQALIKPIEERIKETQREGQALQEQRQAWQGLKADVTDVLQAQRQLAAEAKAAAAEQKKTDKEKALAGTTDLATIFKPEAITAVATKTGESFLKGFNAYLAANGARLIGGALGTVIGGAAFGPLGAIAGAAFGSQFVQRMQEHFGTLENLGGAIAGKLSDALNIDTGKANNAVEAFAIIFETMRDRAIGALEALRTGIIEKLQGAQDGMSGFQKTWQEMFGSDSAGAQAGIAAIDGINKALQALQLLMQGDVTGAVNTLKESFAQFGVAGSLGVDQLTISFDQLKDVLLVLAPIVAGIATAFVVFQTLTAVVTVVTALGAAFGVVSTAVGALASIFAVGSLELGVTGVGAAFAALGLEVGGASTILGGIVALLGGPVTLAIGAVALVVGTLTAAWLGNWGDIQGVTATAIATIQQGYTDFSTFLTDGTAALWTGIQNAWNTGVAAIQGIQTALWNALTPENQQKIQELQALFTELWTVVQQLWTTATTAIMATTTKWWTDITTATQSGWTTVQLYWDEGLKGIQELLAPAYKFITDATTALFTQLSALWEGAKTILGPIAASLGTTIMKALTDALNAAVGGVVDAVTGAVKKAIDAAKSLIGTFSTSGGGGGGTLMSNVVGGSKASPQLQASINAAAGRHGLDPALFTAQLQHESAGFDPNVISGARRGGSGEIGIGQFMEATLMPRLQRAGISLQQYLSDVNVQIEESAKMMEELVKQYGSIDKALQAYNGGPGGVGSAATQRYSQIVHEVASTLQTQSAGKLMSTGGTGAMQLNIDQITAGKQAGLTMEEAQTICGPYAAMLFAQATGMTPTLQQAKELGAAVGWNSKSGMGGTGNFMNLLGRMGIDAVRQAATPANVNAALAAGNPIALSTPRHYFVGAGGSAEGGINVGATGTVMGGKPNMTLAEITALGGGMNDLIVLTGKLNESGSTTFNNLTRVSGQFGTGISADTQQLATINTTLAASIQQGIVPAGLAARDALGQMAIGTQPLIAAWANGEMTSNQLAESLVQVAAKTGLATEPLARFEAGNASVGEALRTVMTALAAADPAFAQIQTAMGGAQLSTEQLADVMLSGLANVTGSVTASMGQIATGAAPIQAAFASGAISSEQFVQSVVQLAATSGLTQAPLRMMQDGVINTNQALADVLQTATDTNPALAEMGTTIADLPAPATDAATAFLDWVKSLQEAQAATTEATDSVERVPDAVTAIQAPMADASTDAMQTLPTATTEALDTTVSAIHDIEGPASEAARAVGEAIVKSLREAVEAGAEEIANAAKEIVEKALEAAKKAADAVKKSAGKSGDGGDDSEEKASGGRMTPGVWTLVGEEGPELISPNGYVYTASETAGMLAQSVGSGIATLHKYAKGSKSSSTSQKSGATGYPGNIAWVQPENIVPKHTTQMTGAELDLAQQIAEVTKDRSRILAEIAPIEAQIAKEEYEQQKASKGNVEVQLKLVGLKRDSLANDVRIAELQVQSMGLRQDEANLQAEIDRITKGSLQDQLRMFELQRQRNKLDLETNILQQQAAPLRAEAAKLELEITTALSGSVEQRQIIAANTKRTVELDLQALNIQQKMLPVQEQMRKLQQQIDDVQRGSLSDQYESIDVQKRLAQLRLEEININGQLRDVNAGVLNLSQDEINALQRQLEVINNQKAQVQDQTEIRQLNATIATTDAQKQLAALQQQDRAHQDVAAGISYERNLIQGSTDQINAQNAVSVAGQQAKLTELNSQIGVYDAQVQALQAQNAVLDLQVQNIQLSNTIRADALGAQLINLQFQVAQYDQMIARVQQENAVIQAQSQLIKANNDLSAVGHEANLIQLNAQIASQKEITTNLNIQLGTLNAQKKAYEDMRNLADTIANRPPAAPGTETRGSFVGGPPGTVVATADGGGPTLYLSRGTGVDGWYTSDGRMVMQGGTSSPPSGYRTHWLAGGGTWHKGDVAVLGERGPEIAIAERDMHVFPHEESARIARSFGRINARSHGGNAYGYGAEGEGRPEKHVTVQVEYHRHGGTDYGEGTLPQVIREAVHIGLRG